MPLFEDRTAEEWTGNRGERDGMTCSKGPQEESNPGPLRRGHSLSVWGVCSTDCATRRPTYYIFNRVTSNL